MKALTITKLAAAGEPIGTNIRLVENWPEPAAPGRERRVAGCDEAPASAGQ